jgi:hypothetical protein
MRPSRCIEILALAFLLFISGAAFGDSFNFAADGTGKLANHETFTDGSSSIAVYGYQFDDIKGDLYFGSGLGLNAGTAHEIGGLHFVQFTDADIASISIDAFGRGASWALFGSNQLGLEGTLLASGVGDRTVDVSAFDTPYKFLSLSAIHGHLLLENAAVKDVAVVSEPSSFALFMTVAVVGLFELTRRKLFA